MKAVNIHAAKTDFSHLVDAAVHGEEAIIAKAEKPAARLVPWIRDKAVRRFGVMKGKLRISDDFDAALPEALLEPLWLLTADKRLADYTELVKTV